MAQKVVVTLVDDLDGTISEDVATVEFGLNGVTYEIDLSNKNAERLRDSLAEFIGPARRTGGRKKKSGQVGTPSGNSSNGDAGLIRAWALENGFELSGRGRIPGHVMEAYREQNKSSGSRNGPSTPVFEEPTTKQKKAGTSRGTTPRRRSK